MKKLMFLMMIVLLIGSVSAIDWTNGVVTYYSLNESTGATADDISVNSPSMDGTLYNMENEDWVNGKLNNSLNFSSTGTKENITSANNVGITGAENRSVFAWVNITDNADQNAIVSWGVGSDKNEFGLVVRPQTGIVRIELFNADLSSPGDNFLPNNFTFVGMTLRKSSFNSTSGHIRIYVNNTLIAQANKTINTLDGKLKIGGMINTASWDTTGTIDEVGVWNRTLSTADITDLYNEGQGITFGESGSSPGSVSVALNKPDDISLHETDFIFFNTTLTPAIANITNATIYIWNSSSDIFNKTFNAFTGFVANETTWNISNFSLSTTYHWNVLGCVDNSSDDAVCSWATNNFTFTSSAFTADYVQYNYSLFETQREHLTINISANPSISSASASLWYNGSSHTSTVTDGTAGIYKAVNDIDIPLAESDGNKTFYWAWSFVLTDGSATKQNSTTYSHEVNRTRLVYCDSTYDIQYVNFTSHTSVNPYPMVNATWKSSIQHWLGTGDTFRNYSFEDITETNHTANYCAFPEDKTYYTNTQLEFDGTGYSQNYHYLVNASLTNTTNSIDVYLINESLATLTVLRVRDKTQNPIANVYIQIQLYDVGTDTFYTVGMAKTSLNGEDLAYLNWYDTLYKFVLTKDGSVLKSTDPYKISETPQIFDIITGTTFTYDKFKDFLYDLYYNSVTENFVLTFTKPSGLVDSGCLRVIKRTAANDTQICNVCETSSSATLYCNIAGQGNGTYVASFYATGSLQVIDTISQFIGDVNIIFDQIGNTDGSIYAILFGGLIVSLLLFSPILAIIGLILAMLGAVILGFQPINYLELIGIAVLGGTVIWILKR